ncbi:MAG: transferase [Syntrophus sp. (in: bacteria)]|nr:transferase [Syntrophus sp. (in: bacteria)]
MGRILDQKLKEIEDIIRSGLDARGARQILGLLEGPAYSLELLEELKIYSDYLPLGHENPMTDAQRYLHFLWDAFDKLPLCLFVPFSIPFRRLIAGHLFKRCGAGLISEENVRFNFGRYLEVGDFVFFNRGVFIDTKGGVTIGNHVALAEDVRIFTHSHSESSHIVREYQRVIIKDYAKIYSGATILPGVTVGEQAIVASHSLVSQDVPPCTLVAGMPAKVIRERKTEGKRGEDLDHIWLF